MGKTKSIRNKQQKFRDITSAGALNIVSPPSPIDPSQGIFFSGIVQAWDGWMEGGHF